MTRDPFHRSCGGSDDLASRCALLLFCCCSYVTPYANIKATNLALDVATILSGTSATGEYQITVNGGSSTAAGQPISSAIQGQLHDDYLQSVSEVRRVV